jgi:CheY-like chemotaxis protein
MKYRHILLIDDDEDDQEIFTTALEEVSKSITLTALGNAPEALRKLLTGAPLPDLIFLDLNMPLMNGEQFLAEIKRNVQLQSIPVIILSTSSNLATVELTKKLGAIDFVTKPDRFDELTRILKTVLLTSND